MVVIFVCIIFQKQWPHLRFKVVPTVFRTTSHHLFDALFNAIVNALIFLLYILKCVEARECNKILPTPIEKFYV